MSDFTEQPDPEDLNTETMEEQYEDEQQYEEEGEPSYDAETGLYSNPKYNIQHPEIDLSNVPEETSQDVRDVDDSRYNAQDSYNNDREDWRSMVDPPGDVTPNWFRKGEGVDLPEDENPHHDISDSNFGRNVDQVLNVSSNDSKLVERSREEIHPHDLDESEEQSYEQPQEDSYVNQWGEGGEVLSESQMRANRSYQPTDGWGGKSFDNGNQVFYNDPNNMTPMWVEEEQGGNITVDEGVNERNQGKFEPYDPTNILDPELDEEAPRRSSLRTPEPKESSELFRSQLRESGSRDSNVSNVSKEQIDAYLQGNPDKHSTPLKNRVSFSGNYNPNDSQNAPVVLVEGNRSDRSMNSLDGGFANTKSNMSTPEKSHSRPKLPKKGKNQSQASFRDSLLSSLHLASSRKSLSDDECADQQQASKSKIYTQHEQSSSREIQQSQSLPLSKRDRELAEKLNHTEYSAYPWFKDEQNQSHKYNRSGREASKESCGRSTNSFQTSNYSADSSPPPLAVRVRASNDIMNGTDYMIGSSLPYSPNASLGSQGSPVRRLQFSTSLPNRMDPYNTSVLLNGSQVAHSGPYHHINNGSLKIVANPTVLTAGGPRGVSPQKIQHLKDAIDAQVNDVLDVTHGHLPNPEGLDSKRKSSIKYFVTSYLGHFIERIDVINNVLHQGNDRDFTKLQQDLLQEKEFLLKQVGVLSQFKNSIDREGIPDSSFFTTVQADLEVRSVKNDLITRKLALKQKEVDQMYSANAKLTTDIYIAKKDTLTANMRYETKVTENASLSAELTNLRNENNAAMIKLMKTEDSLKLIKSGNPSASSLSKKRSSILDMSKVLPTDQKELQTKLQAKDKLAKDLKKNVDQLQSLVDDLTSQKGELTSLRAKNAAVIENLSNEVFKVKQEMIEKDHTMAEVVREFTKKDTESKSLQTSLLAATQENEILVAEHLNVTRERANASLASVSSGGSGDQSQVDALIDINGSLMRENDRLAVANETLNLSLMNQTYPQQHQHIDTVLNRSAATGNTSFSSPGNTSFRSVVERSINSTANSTASSLNQSSFDVDDLKEQISMLNNRLNDERYRGKMALLKAQKEVAFFQAKCTQEGARYASRDTEIEALRAQLSQAGMEIENLGNEHAHARTELERQVEHYRDMCRALDSSLHNASLDASREVANCRSCHSMKKALKKESAKMRAHYESQCDRRESVILRQREKLNRAQQAVRGLAEQKEAMLGHLKQREDHLTEMTATIADLMTQIQDKEHQFEERMLSMTARLNKSLPGTQDANTSVLEKSLKYLQDQEANNQVSSLEVVELREALTDLKGKLDLIKKQFRTVKKVVNYCKVVLKDIIKSGEREFAMRQASRLLEYISIQHQPSQVITTLLV